MVITKDKIISLRSFIDGKDTTQVYSSISLLCKLMTVSVFRPTMYQRNLSRILIGLMVVVNEQGSGSNSASLFADAQLREICFGASFEKADIVVELRLASRGLSWIRKQAANLLGDIIQSRGGLDAVFRAYLAGDLPASLMPSFLRGNLSEIDTSFFVVGEEGGDLSNTTFLVKVARLVTAIPEGTEQPNYLRNICSQLLDILKAHLSSQKQVTVLLSPRFIHIMSVAWDPVKCHICPS
jgi:hypothetical protein